MEDEKKEILESILKEAKKAPKRNYSIYSNFSSRIFNLSIDYKSTERALIRLANILKV